MCNMEIKLALEVKNRGCRGNMIHCRTLLMGIRKSHRLSSSRWENFIILTLKTIQIMSMGRLLTSLLMARKTGSISSWGTNNWIEWRSSYQSPKPH